MTEYQKSISFEIQIQASPDAVWQKMLSPETYNDWAKGFSADSQYVGEWKESTYINFIDPKLGGTRALLQKIDPHKEIIARHIAILDTNQKPDVECDVAKKWIGTIESYQFSDLGGQTILKVTTEVHEDFVKMFEESWPKSLGLLKALCES